MGKPVFVGQPKWKPPAPGQPVSLRPLNLGEKLDAGFKLWARNFLTLVIPVLLFTAPLSVLSTFVQASIDENAFDLDAEATTASDVGTQIAGQAAQVGIGVIAGVLATAAVVQAVSDAYTGGRPDWRSSIRFALRRLPSLLWVGLLMTVAVLVALGPPVALFVLGGTTGIVLGVLLSLAALGVLTWLFVPWLLAYAPLLVEDLRGVAVLRRTMALVRGRWWPTFGTELVMLMIVSLIGMPIVFMFGLVAGLSAVFGEGSEVTVAILTTFGTVLQNAIVLPLQAAVVVIIYFDLRVRKEGFDLELLTQQLGRPPQAAAAPAPAVGDPHGFGPPGG